MYDKSKNYEETINTTDLDKLCSVKNGRILRIKEGYNPNSSSMGSIVFHLPASLIGITAAYGVLSSILIPGLIKKMEKKLKKNDSNEK